jgi:hypothetical protein
MTRPCPPPLGVAVVGPFGPEPTPLPPTSSGSGALIASGISSIPDGTPIDPGATTYGTVTFAALAGDVLILDPFLSFQWTGGIAGDQHTFDVTLLLDGIPFDGASWIDFRTANSFNFSALAGPPSRVVILSAGTHTISVQMSTDNGVAGTVSTGRLRWVQYRSPPI